MPASDRRALRCLGLGIGAPLLGAGLSLYHAGRVALGPMYQGSSGFGVRLYRDHRLVTSGPYAVVRHPMYLGVALAASGALLLYRRWATVGGLLMVPSVLLRARREETALELEFGDDWRTYRATVPAWIPRVPLPRFVS